MEDEMNLIEDQEVEEPKQNSDGFDFGSFEMDMSLAPSF